MAEVDQDQIQAGLSRFQEVAEKFGVDASAAPTWPVGSGQEHREGAEGEEYAGDDGSLNKRKFGDEPEEDGPMRKRPSFNGPEDGNGATYAQDYAAGDPDGAPGADAPASAPAADGSITDWVDCPKKLVGKLIGRQGATIQELQNKSDTRIQVQHQTPGDITKVEITGRNRDMVEKAKALIQETLDSENPSSGPGEITRTVECPQGIVGRVIGKGGETIKGLQMASGAHIVVNQNFPDGVPREVNISGKADSVNRAHNMVTELINGNPGSAQAVIQKYGVGITKVVDCPKSMVGRVIGKGGETIKTLQKNTSASIQIDQSTDPCRVTISGGHEAVRQAETMVREIANGNNPFTDPIPGAGAGGGGGFGAPRGPGGFHGGGFAPQYAPAPYGGGYSGYPAPAANPYAPQPFYGAPGGYGANPYQAAAAPASYGGYGGYGGGAADPYASSYGGGYGSGGGAGGGAGAASGGAAVWQEHFDNENRPYYYNTQTGATQWEKPAEMQ